MAELTPAQRFGEHVYTVRAGRGWSMKQTAIKAGLTHAQDILRAERGDELGLSKVVAIAAALGLSLDALAKPAACLGCDDRPPPGFTCTTCSTTGRP